MSKSLPAMLILLVSAAAMSTALDPPVKMWERWYYTNWDVAGFNSTTLTQSGDILLTGAILDYSPGVEDIVAVLVNQDGDVLWEVRDEFAGAFTKDSNMLPDGSFILVGSALADTSSTTTGVYIHKISESGATEWARIYGYETTDEDGYGVACLPDGGFAICGRVNGSGGGLGQAWILRTDVNGDTLWTDVWGEHTINFAKSIVFDQNNNWIVACVYGRSDTLVNRGPHLLYYSLDGTFLHGTTYPELYPEWVRGMCAATDGGFTFLSRYGTGQADGTLTHTDPDGEILWSHTVPAQVTDDNDNLGLGFTQIDGGYVCCGWTGYWSPPSNPFPFTESVSPVDTGSTKDGWLMRYAHDGTFLWSVENEIGGDNHFYSAVQLPQGGYIAAGSSGGGYLVRYAPETGIVGPEIAQASILSIAPNPFTSSLSISYCLTESGEVCISIYNLAGKRVANLDSGYEPAGNHGSLWTPETNIPNGCYLVVLDTYNQRIVGRCVKLD
jgi:hypothetical protein